jgi:hypothetical protein
MWIGKRFFFNQNSNLNFIVYDFNRQSIYAVKEQNILKRFRNLESLGTNNLILLFNLVLNTNFIAHNNTFDHYDL